MSISQPTSISIQANIYTKKAFYLLWMPLGMPYSKYYNQIKAAGFAIDDGFGIIEKGTGFGMGWIGVKVENPDSSTNCIKLEGEFIAVEITGAYSQIKTAYDQIMKDYPNAKEFYNIYYNSPRSTPEAELKTRILFR